MTIHFTTNFSGADADPIGAPFSPLALMGGGDIQRVSGVAFGSNAGQRNQVSVDGLSLPDHYIVAAQIGDLGAGGGLMGAAIAGGNGTNVWSFGCDDGGLVYLSRIIAGPNFTDVMTPASRAHTPGDVYALEVEQVGADVVLTPRVNGEALYGSFTEVGRTMGGLAGILLRNDDCEGLALVIADFALPLTQSFATIEAGQTLVEVDPRFEQISGSFDGAVGGGALSTDGGGDHLARVIGATFDDAQYVEWTFDAAGLGGFNGGALRVDDTGTGYGIIQDGSQTFLNVYASGSFAGSIAGSGSPIAAPATGDRCRFEFGVGGVPGAWRLLFDGVVAASGTDNTIASGSGGLAGFNGVSPSLVDYETGNLAAPATDAAGPLVSDNRLKSLTAGGLAQ